MPQMPVRSEDLMKRLTAAALLFACAMPVAAQNAIGSGNKLDRSPQKGSGGVNQPTQNDLQESLRLRNAIVTGNAAGGMSFRGSVGYVGEREFRGELGSDDLFSFRRDSLYSGISGLGIRGTDALQYQFAMTTGSRPPTSIAGSLAISRDSFSGQVGDLGVNDNALKSDEGPIRRLDPAEQQDVAGTGLWRLRSASGYITDKSLASSYIGTLNTGQGETYDVTASPLEGVRVFDPATVSPGSQGLRPQTTTNTQNLIQRLAPNNSALIDSTGLTGHEKILSRLRDSYSQTADSTTAQDLVQQVLNQNDKIREYLEGITSIPALDTNFEGETPTDGSPGNEIPEEDLTPRQRLIRDFEEMDIDPAIIEAMRSSSTTVDELIANASPADRNYYAIHLNQGHQSMKEGNYFDAEARFALALSIKPGDPTASMARVHAQIGAGLTMSAATNLRETFTVNPTMITARYAPGLIPPASRLRDMVPRLQTLADGAGLRARQSALVLAYIGYQLNDDAVTKEGLDRLELETEDRLAALLRLIWLDNQPVGEALEDTPQIEGGTGDE